MFLFSGIFKDKYTKKIDRTSPKKGHISYIRGPILKDPKEPFFNRSIIADLLEGLAASRNSGQRTNLSEAKQFERDETI